MNKMPITWPLIFVSLMSSCTISFQNISTHGTATDLVDETQAPQNQADAELHFPAL